MTLEIDEFTPVGVHTVQFTLTDDNLSNPKQSDYKIIVIINERNIEEEFEFDDDSYTPPGNITSQDPDIIVVGVDELGEMTLLFTQRMKIPYDWREIDELVLSIEIFSVDVEFTYKR